MNRPHMVCVTAKSSPNISRKITPVSHVILQILCPLHVCFFIYWANLVMPSATKKEVTVIVLTVSKNKHKTQSNSCINNSYEMVLFK